jgi:hypothetical protein
VRPLSPMITTGESLCASARSSLRRFGVSGIGAVYAKRESMKDRRELAAKQ